MDETIQHNKRESARLAGQLKKDAGTLSGFATHLKVLPPQHLLTAAEVVEMLESTASDLRKQAGMVEAHPEMSIAAHVKAFQEQHD